MYMHATTGDSMRQSVLIRKNIFVAQYRRKAGRTDHFA